MDRQTPITDAAERGEISTALAEQWLNGRADMHREIKILTALVQKLKESLNGR